MLYLLGIVVLALGWILPWWGFCAICFLLGHKFKSASSSFFTAFVSIASVWLIVTYIQNMQSHGLIAEKMAEVFSLPNGIVMIVVSAIFGGLLAGLWSLSGYLLHQIILKSKAKRDQAIL